MTRPKPDFGTLNAYVDGELDAAAAAMVAEAAAADPQVAGELAKLHAMKATVGDAFDVPALVAVYPPRSRGADVARLAAAAGLAAMIVGAGLWFGSERLSQRAMSHNAVAEAVADHDLWLDQPDKTVPVAVAAGFLLPDLSPAGLAVARIDTTVRLNGVPATQVGYVGKNGCHLSLFIVRTDTALDIASATADKAVLADAWVAGQAAYLTVARHMNPTRFATLVQALKLATKNSTPLDERVRTALADAHQPCIS